MLNIDFLKQKLKSNWAIILLFVVVGFSLYGNTLNNELFWDDDQFILQNQYIKDWQHFPKFFSENLIAGAGQASDYWRPALLTVFAIEWHLWGPSEFGFHLTNILFHVADALLLFYVLQKLFSKKSLSLFVCLIFLIHPLQTEAVSYANSLGDSLSVFFMFASILLYLNFRSKQVPITESYSFYGSIVCFILALLSKETAIILPGLLILCDFVFSKTQNRNSNLKSLISDLWPFFATALAYIILRATALNFVNTFNLYNEQNIFTSSIFVRIFTFFRILTEYVSLIFWPQILHMERSVQVATNLFAMDVMLGAGIFLLLITIAVASIKKNPLLSFGVFWFFIGLALTSNILVPINGLLYEHWLYLPIIGMAIVVFWLGQRLSYHLPSISKAWPIIAILVFIPMSARTIARNNDWDNSIRFYTQVLEHSPNSYRVTNNLGMEMAERGIHDQAIFIYYKAIVLDDKNPVAYHNLANSYRDTKKTDLAIQYYNKALELDPEFYYTYGALANVYINAKEYDKAIATLREYVKYFPSGKEEIELIVSKLEKEKAK